LFLLRGAPTCAHESFERGALDVAGERITLRRKQRGDAAIGSGDPARDGDRLGFHLCRGL